MESARHAVAEDLPAVAALAEAAIAELTPTRGGEVWARREARSLPAVGSIAAAHADPAQLVAVGTIDEAVVGYAAVRLERLRDGATLAVLDDLYVAPDARGVGVGEAMMNLVLAWAEGEGCIGIDSVALPGNRATKNFFESFGLVARAIVVHRALTTEDGPS